MTQKQEKGRPRRIAVALDASEQSLRVMGLAAAIAAAMEAELEGVFVEDADLLRLAGLPFLREFRLSSRCEEEVDAERLQRELRATARRVRASLEQSASQRGCAWSFRIWRGDLEAEILSAALDAEMFTLGPIGRFAPFRNRPKANAPVRQESDFVVTVLFDGSDGAVRALTAATDLAARHKGSLSVIVQGQDPAEIVRLRAKAAELLGESQAKARLVPMHGSDAQTLARTVKLTGSDLLVVDATNSLLDRRTLWLSLSALHCPVLIVR